MRDLDGKYDLAIQQGTLPARALPGIAPSIEPFDANIGPGPSGSPEIVFARCHAAHRCALLRTTLAGNLEAPISAAAGLGGYAPAVWRNRLAFARRSAHGADEVFVVPLEAGKRARSLRFRSAPRPECVADVGKDCFSAVVHPTVTELSLRGSTLAENVKLGVVENSELCPRTEARVVDLAHLRSRRVAHTYCGLSGPTLLGVSLTATRLFYAVICPGDPAGCHNHNGVVYRYGLRDHRSELHPTRDLLAGFAALGDSSAVEVTAPRQAGMPVVGATCLDGAGPPCDLVRTGQLAFTAPSR